MKCEQRLIAGVSGDVILTRSYIWSTLNSPKASAVIRVSSLTTHRYTQDVGQLVRLRLTEAVPCVCHKHNRHRELSLRIHQLLEGPLGRGDRQPSPDEHAINVEQQAKAWLWLQERRADAG